MNPLAPRQPGEPPAFPGADDHVRLPPGLSPEAGEAFRAFIRLAHAHRQLITTLMGKAGGHPAQAGVLRVLTVRDGISQRELGQTLFLTAPSVTTMLQRMERTGIVERRPDPSDARIARVHLTPAGRELSEAVHHQFTGHLARMFDGFREDELHDVRVLLGRMADNMTTVSRTETPAKPAGTDPTPSTTKVSA